MKSLTLSLLVLCVGCAHARTFQLKDGTVATCSRFFKDECGVTLWSCEDGHKYICQDNFRRIK